MNTLSRFRMVSLSPEIREEFDLPEIICADPKGMPFLEGQLFYQWMRHDNDCMPATARSYLHAVLLFCTFLWHAEPPLNYDAPAQQIRKMVREYLRKRLGCAVVPHRNGNFLVKPSNIVMDEVNTNRPITFASARLRLAALKRFYFWAKLEGRYSDPNPLEWYERPIPAREFKPHMPVQSGMVLPEPRGRLTDTYFCFVGKDWEPQIIDDPKLRQHLLSAIKWKRDKIIVRILLDSGARVSEVLRLTVGDWRKKGQYRKAFTTNKGSRGVAIKEIWWSDETEILLRNYVHQERRRCDVGGRDLDELPDSAPVFTNAQGNTYTYAAFYRNWQEAMEEAHLKITPHQIRHWYVTMALTAIASEPDESKREGLRRRLIQYMGWRNPHSIEAYDHHIQKQDFTPIQEALAHLGEMPHDQSPKSKPAEAAPPPQGLNIISDDLERLLTETFKWSE
jgi:integrase